MQLTIAIERRRKSRYEEYIFRNNGKMQKKIVMKIFDLYYFMLIHWS